MLVLPRVSNSIIDSFSLLVNGKKIGLFLKRKKERVYLIVVFEKKRESSFMDGGWVLLLFIDV